MYEAYLKEKGLVKNSTSYYMRIWRSVYNLAVEQGYTTDKKPFKHVYTGIDKTVKRAVPFKIIKMIKELDLSFEPQLELARDIFLFSFYTRGMSFIDTSLHEVEHTLYRRDFPERSHDIINGVFHTGPLQIIDNTL